MNNTSEHQSLVSFSFEITVLELALLASLVNHVASGVGILE